MAVEFRLLGDAVIWHDGPPVPVRGTVQHAALAAGLALGLLMIGKWAGTVTATTGIRPSPLASGT